MKIACIDKEIQEVFKTKFYKIPRFQRPYSWDKENVEDFWSDAIVNNQYEYFIGSIVTYNYDRDTYGVVDGQQRLTTITMLLCALRDVLKENNLLNLAHGINNLITKTDLDNNEKFVLQTETSYPFLQEYIQKFGDADLSYEEKEEEKALKVAFQLLNQKVRSSVEVINNDPTLILDSKPILIEQKLREIRDKILQLKLIFIELDNEDDAYIIFETLNTRGKDLGVSDLVKNHVTKLLRTRNNDVDAAKDKWSEARDIIESSAENLSMDSFLLHLWLAKYEYTTQKKLFKLLKKQVKKPNAKLFLNEVLHSAKVYRGFQETEYRSWKKEEYDLRNSLEALVLFRVKQPIPMILSVMSDYENKVLNLKNAKSIIKAIENFHFVFSAVTSQRSSGGISLMYAYHARNLVNSDNIEDKVKELRQLKAKLHDKKPGLEEFKANFEEIWYSALHTKQSKLVRYILNKVHKHLYPSEVPIDYDQMTIEHILPQRPKESLDDGFFIPFIGNLLLIDKGLNDRLGNKTFLEKKEILIERGIHLDPILLNASSWGRNEINERTMYFAEVCYNEIFK